MRHSLFPKRKDSEILKKNISKKTYIYEHKNIARILQIVEHAWEFYYQIHRNLIIANRINVMHSFNTINSIGTSIFCCGFAKCTINEFSACMNLVIESLQRVYECVIGYDCISNHHTLQQIE